MSSIPNDYYKEFNNFQTAFYTNIENFNNFSNFEVKKHGYVLLNNMGKGFPALANIILNTNGIGWKGVESKPLLQALQRLKFVNGFNRINIPAFIYYSGKNNKEPKNKKTIKSDNGLIFSNEIKSKIQSILFYDEKTYEYLKFEEEIQYLGKQLLGEIQQKEKVKEKVKELKLKKKPKI